MAEKTVWRKCNLVLIIWRKSWYFAFLSAKEKQIIFWMSSQTATHIFIKKSLNRNCIENKYNRFNLNIYKRKKLTIKNYTKLIGVIYYTFFSEHIAVIKSYIWFHRVFFRTKKGNCTTGNNCDKLTINKGESLILHFQAILLFM